MGHSSLSGVKYYENIKLFAIVCAVVATDVSGNFPIFIFIHHSNVASTCE